MAVGLVLLLAVLHSPLASGDFVSSGRIFTRDHWVFLTFACFEDEPLSPATFFYNVTFAQDSCCQNLLFYSADQWAQVYPSTRMNCSDKERVLGPTDDHVLPLTREQQQCHVNSRTITCTQQIQLPHRSPCWYIAVSNCDENKGLQLEYKITFKGGWENPAFMARTSPTGSHPTLGSVHIEGGGRGTARGHPLLPHVTFITAWSIVALLKCQ